MPDQRWIAEAEKVLPCKYQRGYCFMVRGEHKHDSGLAGCPAHYRTVFAQALQEAYEKGLKWKYEPRCIDYPDCDGDFVAESHDPKCPMYGKEQP